MRRASDIEPGGRNGRGRRARDRLLSGEAPALAEEPASSDLEHLMYFVGDDLRAAAMAVGGIERFLLAAERQLAEGPDADELADLVDDAAVDDRLGDLECALGSLVHALERLRDAVGQGAGRYAGGVGADDVATAKTA